MKNRSVLLVVAITLACALNYSSSASATTYPSLAGKKCAKLGATKIYYSSTFICIKVGKRLVWNKGKPIMAVPLKPTR
jgi:hypothetical protein